MCGEHQQFCLVAAKINSQVGEDRKLIKSVYETFFLSVSPSKALSLSVTGFFRSQSFRSSEGVVINAYL